MESLDIISNLPEQVICTILDHLPISDAVRTSLLSNNWRYKWTFIPNLVFNERNICSYTDDHNLRTYKLVNFVDRVLLRHKGFIHKFELFSHTLKDYDIDSWILFLSQNRVKELVLTFPIGKTYEVLSSFFSCEAICYLKLFRCILKAPLIFKGFSDLRSLNLERVSLADEVLESMISSSIVLEVLVLRFIQLKGCSCIKICAPNLEHFSLEGEFADICFIDTPQLSFVSITLNGNASDKPFGQGEISNLVRILGSLTGLENLAIRGCFMEFLAMGNLPKRLPITYNQLKSISLEINFEDLNHTMVMQCLFQSSPNLQELEMVAYDDDATEYVEGFWKAQGCLNCSMNQLCAVKMRMCGAQPELDFMEFLLANSPLLELLSVELISVEKVAESRVLNELMKFRRASAKAQIEYNMGWWPISRFRKGRYVGKRGRM